MKELFYLFSNEMQVKLNLSLLEDISDDIDFCFKLAKEESVIILPGTVQIMLYLAFLHFLFGESFIYTEK